VTSSQLEILPAAESARALPSAGTAGLFRLASLPGASATRAAEARDGQLGFGSTRASYAIGGVLPNP